MMGWPVTRLLLQYSVDRNNGSCSLTALSNPKVIQFAHCIDSPSLTVSPCGRPQRGVDARFLLALIQAAGKTQTSKMQLKIALSDSWKFNIYLGNSMLHWELCCGPTLKEG